MAIAYVEHPVGKQEKKDYQKKGFKVVDVRFKPEKLGDGDKVFIKKKPETKLDTDKKD